MRLLITNISAKTPDDHRFDFESTGPLERENEYSGLAVTTALYIVFAAPKQAHPVLFSLALRKSP